MGNEAGVALAEAIRLNATLQSVSINVGGTRISNRSIRDECVESKEHQKCIIMLLQR